jgi:hypothetical protein
MFPSWDQIQVAAYHRWQRRGGAHGHDHADWSAAEMDLTFEFQYETILHLPLDPGHSVVLGRPDRPTCRFCELSPPETVFNLRHPVVPDAIVPNAIISAEVCQDCQAFFRDALGEALAAFWNLLPRLGGSQRAWDDVRTPQTLSVSIPAFKALAWLALSVVPRAELEYFPDAIEWVCNPDHDRDRGAFHELGCSVYPLRHRTDSGWLSLARRRDSEDDDRLPYLLLFLGAHHFVVEVAVPLCLRDEDLESGPIRLPRRSFSTGYEGDVEPSSCLALPLAASQPRPRPQRIRWIH